MKKRLLGKREKYLVINEISRYALIDVDTCKGVIIKERKDRFTGVVLHYSRRFRKYQVFSYYRHDDPYITGIGQGDLHDTLKGALHDFYFR